jgi:hypothetical protein
MEAAVRMVYGLILSFSSSYLIVGGLFFAFR